MSVYTYVVIHEDCPVISSAKMINGGSLKAVQFSDALEELEDIKKFLSELRDSTKDDQTRYAIDDFLH